MSAIEVESLTKEYGRFRAVEGISFSVGEGEVVGFLGPNGAGKSTTMRMLAGYLMPTSGEIKIDGLSMTARSRELRGLIGYLPESVALYTDMTTRGYLEYVARLRGLSKAQAKSKTEEVIATCALSEYRDTALRKLSKGYRQRVGLAQSVIHDPRFLILDEPTIGIDPIQITETRGLIKELGRDRTILLSSHILPEVSMICERVIIIHRGHIAGEDRIENLSAVLSGGQRTRLRVGGPADAVSATLEGVKGVRHVVYEEPYHVVDTEPNVDARGEIAQSVVENGFHLLAMEESSMSLEEIFLELTKEGSAQR